MRKIWSTIALFIHIPFAFSQNAEEVLDTKAHNLDEVVVKGKNFWMEGDKYVFRPERREKNLSRTMEDLIRRMHTGILTVEDGIITTNTGQQVNIFINGIPADNLDKSTFWAKNAMRVEYMPFSDDPTFNGATNIVNFVMREYVAGGLTRFDGNQQFPNDGKYSAASKLVWGKMTYNALFKGSYSRDHQSGSTASESYYDIFYNNSFYEEVIRNENTHNIKRSDGMYGGFNARYRTDNVNITHSVALQWQQNPGSVSQGAIAYSPAIIHSNSTVSKSAYHSLSPQIDGYYSFNLSPKFNLSANWILKHSHNNNRLSYEDIGLNPILTLSKENLYNMAARVTAVWYPRNNLVVQFALEEDRTISDACYDGEVSARQWQNHGRNMLQLLGWWRIANNLTLQIIPQLTLYDRDVNHITKKHDWLPGINATVGWRINDRHGINFQSWYYLNNPMSFQSNDLILRQSELKWIEGNPNINSSSNYWFSLAYNTYPSDWLNNSLSLEYVTHADEPYLLYRSGGNEYDGVIGSYQNASANRTYRLHWSFNISLFNDNVSIGNQLDYSHQTINRHKIDWVRTRPYVSWNFGNCSLSANYGTPEKFFRQGGTHIVHTPSYYNIDFSYGNGNLILDLEVRSPFNKRITTTYVCHNGPYHYTSKDWNNGRSISVSMTYTFDYGKKINPGVEIFEQNIKSSSVLTSK